MIDLTKQYRVEPKAIVADSSNLGREGLSKHVGTQTGLSLSYNPDTNRYKTGLDEFAPEVKALPEEKQKAKIEWIRQTKKTLEDQSGVNLDANNDDFWSLWRVYIEVGQDKKTRVMGGHPAFQPNLYWEHALALIVLDANDALPKSRKEASDPKFKNSQFFLTTADEENQDAEKSIKKSRKRNVEMSKLFEGDTADFNRAFNIAYLLGIQKEEIGVASLEKVMEAFTPQKEYIDKFLELCECDNEEIVLKVTIKKAIDYDIISYDGEARVYRRGLFSFADTAENTVKVIKNGLAEPNVAREFAEIKAAVVKRDAKKKKK